MHGKDKLQSTGRTMDTMDSTDGYLLSLMDGKLTVDEICSIAPGEHGELRRRLAHLLEAGCAKRVANTVEGGEFLRKLELQERLLEKGDHYRSLGIRKGADSRVMQSVFHKLSLRFHPDKVPKEIKRDMLAMERVSKVYREIQKAYDVLNDPRTRQVWAKTQLRKTKQTATAEADSKSGTAAPKKKVQEGVKPETLLLLARESIQRLEFRSARTNLSLAKQIVGPTSEIVNLEKELGEISKLQQLLQNLDRTDSLGAEEKEKIQQALKQYKTIVMGQRALLSQAFLLAVRFGFETSLTAELFHQLALGTMSIEEYKAGIKYFKKQGLLSTAVETAQKATEAHPKSSDLKLLLRELKRKSK